MLTVPLEDSLRSNDNPLSLLKSKISPARYARNVDRNRSGSGFRKASISFSNEGGEA
jgi:hypothetical protein